MVAQTSGNLATNPCAMIRMSDVSSALEGFKAGRQDSASSLSSWTTTVATPPIITAYASSSSSGSSSSSQAASPFGSMRGSGSTSGGSRSVRFADECGGELVSDVRTTANWWEEMVLGVDRCEACGDKQRQKLPPTPTAATTHSAEEEEEEEEEGAGASSSIAREHESSSAQQKQAAAPTCERCGVHRREGGSPSELFRFIEELSSGVEATLAFPSLVGKKRRSVILYTEDNGESISWMTTGGGKSGEPYRLPCMTLLEVKDKAGAARVGAALAGGRRQPATPTAVVRTGSGLRRATITRRASDIFGGLRGGGDLAGKPPPEMPSLGAEGGTGAASTSYSSSSSSSEEEEEEGGGEEGGCDALNAHRVRGGRAGEVRIRLTWRLKPTWSAQKVTIENVSCSNPAVFTRGMAQLRSHNMDLQQR